MSTLASRNYTADSIRGLAAINVVNAHFISAFSPHLLTGNYGGIFGQAGKVESKGNIFDAPFTTLTFNGHFAVMLFFVLSGYVLSTPYFSKNTEKLKARLAGRYIRLNGPIAASILLAFIVGYMGLYFNQRVGSLEGNTWLQGFYNPNSFSIESLIINMTYQGILDGSGTFNPPLWSLKVEMLGSIFLLLTLITFPPKHFFLGMVFSLSLLFAYFGYSRFFLWILAIFSGALIHRIPVSITTMPFNIICVTLGLYFGAFQFGNANYSWLPKFGGQMQKDIPNIVGAVLLLTPLLKRDFSIFNNRVGKYIGRLSYSVYLLHFPILCSLSCYMYLSSGPLSNLFTMYSFYIVTTFACAHVFERFIDRPSHKIARQFGKIITV